MKFDRSNGRPKRNVVVVIRIEQVRPAKGNDHYRIGSLRRIVLCLALAMLISGASHGGQLLATTKLSLSPPTAPAANTIETNHFVLAVEPRPASLPATDRISSGSSDATRRVLAAAAALAGERRAPKGSRGGLFSTQVGDRGFRIADIQAGYGMVCMDPVFTRSRNGTALEEPCFVYLKKSLKF